MARTAFIKYSLQVRIGNMGGIFVAYHNTFKNFGFEYISLEEMEKAMFGNTLNGDQLFSLSMQLANIVLENVSEMFPGEDTEIFVTRPTNNTLTVLLTPKYKKPRVLLVYTNSLVNGEFHQAPIISGDEKWELAYNIQEIPYNPSLQLTLRSFNKLFGGNGTFASLRFMTDLKELSSKMRLLEELTEP